MTFDANADSLQTAPLGGHPDVEGIVPYPSRQHLRSVPTSTQSMLPSVNSVPIS